jgi:hypothetical protein
LPSFHPAWGGTGVVTSFSQAEFESRAVLPAYISKQGSKGSFGEKKKKL